MTIHTNRWFLFILLWLTISNAQALHGVSIGYGHGVVGLKPLRVGVQKTWNEQWCHEHLGPLQGYWELSAYHMHRANQDELYNNKLTAIALAPVFRWYNNTKLLPSRNVYLEFAIGVAQVNKRTIGSRELGINFQFEDRLGFGIQFGNNKQYDIGYRVIHFSNAYLGHKNHGINLQMLYFNYWFGSQCKK